jgi:DNA anti-recombination protein RmuC
VENINQNYDEQAELLLEKINKRFAEQNKNIDRILGILQEHTEKLDIIYKRLGEI